MLAMPTPNSLGDHSNADINDASPDWDARDTDQHRSDLEALRQDLAAVVGDLKKVVEARTAQATATAKAGVEQGLDAARDTIRSHPVTAVTVALLVGAALAIAIIPARRPPTTRQRLAEWVPATGAQVTQFAHGVQDRVRSSGTMASLGSALERVIESVSSIDPKTSLAPALKQAGTWFSSLKSALIGKT
jgi:ElaB/YqjD/DUF883 family membrane-anchored ribosome-binding protein